MNLTEVQSSAGALHEKVQARTCAKLEFENLDESIKNIYGVFSHTSKAKKIHKGSVRGLGPKIPDNGKSCHRLLDETLVLHGLQEPKLFKSFRNRSVLVLILRKPKKFLSQPSHSVSDTMEFNYFCSVKVAYISRSPGYGIKDFNKLPNGQ